ncbi:DsbA family protein [Mesorhizobium calcicola]|uniref:DsbA family protein n=1 Tax=Mesorhizobium calcicola TaxID=1300310 RepID=A0ABW4WAX9_9HYPH
MFKQSTTLVAAIAILVALLLSALAALKQYPDDLSLLGDHRQLAAELRILILKRRDALLNDLASPIAGNREADVALVSFFDYNCLPCRAAGLNIQQAIRDDANVKLVFKEFPILGSNSEFAAVAALASRQQRKYEAFHLALMNFPGVVNKRTTLTIAGRVGLDVEQLKRDMEDPAIADAIARNRALASGLHITGTPALVVGDEVIPGVVDLVRLQRAIADTRATAKAQPTTSADLAF